MGKGSKKGGRGKGPQKPADYSKPPAGEVKTNPAGAEYTQEETSQKSIPSLPPPLPAMRKETPELTSLNSPPRKSKSEEEGDTESLMPKSPLVQFESVYPNKEEEEELDFYVPPDAPPSPPSSCSADMELQDVYAQPDLTRSPTATATTSTGGLQGSPCRFSFMSNGSLTEIVFQPSSELVEEEAAPDTEAQSIWRVVTEAEHIERIDVSTPNAEEIPVVKRLESRRGGLVEIGEVLLAHGVTTLAEYSPLYIDVYLLPKMIEQLVGRLLGPAQGPLSTLLVKTVQGIVIAWALWTQLGCAVMWQGAKLYFYLFFSLPFSVLKYIVLRAVKGSANGMESCLTRMTVQEAAAVLGEDLTNK